MSNRPSRAVASALEPIDDPDRLAALDGYDILDTTAEEGFDDLVHLAAQICAVPVALVSFVDRDRQWFKARVGFPSCETDLNSSVCQFVLTEPDLLEIPDLTVDARTRANPLVTGEPHIRFYAGAPLRDRHGRTLGSLCVIDKTPRPEGLTRVQREGLKRLARQTMAQLDLRQANAVAARELRSQQRLRALADTSVTLLTAGDPVSLLQPILRAEAGSLGFDQSYTYDLAQDGEYLKLTHAIGVDAATYEMLRHVSCDLPLCGIVARNGQPLILSHIQDGTEPRFAMARDSGLNAYAGYPIASHGRLRGVISFSSTEGPAFDTEALTFFATIARFLSAAKERVEGETALRASEGRYRAVFESAHDYAIIVMTPDGHVTNWNSGATKILGWTPDDICGKPADVFFTPEDREARIPDQEMHSALTEGRGIDERWHLRKSGERFWANGEMMALRDGDGTAVGFVKILRDRTEQRRAAEAVQGQTDLLQTITDHVGQAIFQLDRQGCITFANPAASAIFGYAAEAMQGQSLHALLHHSYPDGRPYPAEECQLREALVDGELLEGLEDTFFRQDGTPLQVQVTNVPVRVGSQITSAVVTVTDITARKAAEQHLADSEARWRGMFEGMQEGFFLGELVRDAAGRARDCRFLEINPAFARQSGLPVDSIGQTIRTFVPDIDQSLIDAYAKVIETGEPTQFEITVPGLNRSFEVRAHKETGDRFSCLFLDITDRKRSEVRRQAAATLSDRLRDQSDTVTIVQAAADVLGRTLGLSHAGYGQVDPDQETIAIAQGWSTPGLPGLAGLHHFRMYGSYIEDLKAGREVIIADTRHDPRTRSDAEALTALGVEAIVNLPVLEHGRFVGMFYALAATPKVWSPEDLAFVRSVADRARAAIARVEAEERQRTLNLELSHRMKNMLAMVQSIATQTMHGATDIDTARDVLANRLVALGKSHDLLLGGTLTNAPLVDLIGNALQLHRDRPDRFVLDGPPLNVGSKAALSLSLMLHELATNAAKYGALSTAAGTVAIAWTVGTEADPTITLTWTEIGGPPVVPPTRTGFGTRLIGRGLAGSFSGQAALEYQPAGVVCTITAPLTGLQAGETPGLA